MKSIPAQFEGLVRHLCARHDANVSVIAGMVEKESGWNPDAIGDNGHSVGLTQLHDAGLGAGMTVDERRDPATNLEIAIRAHVTYRREALGVLRDMDEATRAALAAHNAGGPALRAANWDWRSLYGGSVARIYVLPVMALAAEYGTEISQGDPRTPEWIQLDTIHGLAGRVEIHGLTGTASELRNAVTALKDHLTARGIRVG